MHRAAAHRLTIAWLAMLALVVAALAPVLTRGLVSDAWGQVCSAGAKAATGGGSPVPADDHAAAHCPYCALQLPALGPPPAPVLLPIMRAAALAQPALPQGLQRQVRLWHQANPRAPPALG